MEYTDYCNCTSVHKWSHMRIKPRKCNNESEVKEKMMACVEMHDEATEAATLVCRC